MNALRYCLLFFLFFLFFIGPVHAAESSMQQFHLKDGSTLRGQVLSETEDSYVIQTTFGEVTLKKTDLRNRYIRLVLKDTTVLIGKLLDDNEQFVVEAAMGVVKIERDKVESFEIQFAKSQGDVGPSSLVDLFSAIPGKKEEIKTGYSHSVEPIIDLFFDPTGYTFKKGDVYISGLSLAYGFTDSFLMSVNLVSLAGLNAAGSINPNFEAKLNLIDYRADDWEYYVSVGTKFGLLEHVGNYEVSYVDDVETGRIKRRRWRDYSFNDNANADTSPIPREEEEGPRSRVDFEHELGWQTKFYVAQSLSFLLERGGRLGLHLGAQFELNSFNINELSDSRRRSQRFHFGFDLDLSRSFKLLGEVFHDVDRVNNVITGDEGPVGVDFGLMYAFTDSFRLQVHVQPYFLGFYWRL